MKLTPELLRKIVKEEMDKKIRDVEDTAEKETEEVEADDLADTLENKVDYQKKLEQEARELRHRLARVNERRLRLARRGSR